MQLFKMLLERRDFNRPSKLIALDLIWAATGERIRPNKITFGKARELDQRPDIDYDSNTFVPAEVDKAEDTRYANDSGFMYRRFSLEECVDGRDIVVTGIEGSYKVEDILDQINESLDTQFTLDDLDNDIEYPAGTNKPVIYAHPNSLAWWGDTTITVVSGGPTNNIRVTDLDGFHPYDPTAPS